MIKLKDIINEIIVEGMDRVSIYTPDKMMPEEVAHYMDILKLKALGKGLEPMDQVQLHNDGTKWLITNPKGKLLVYDEDEPDQWKYSPDGKEFLQTLTGYRDLNAVIWGWV